jgi:hypothetical protein
MVQHSSGLDRQKGAISVDILVSMHPSNTILEPMRDASCGGPTALAQDRGDLAPAIEAAQADLPAGHEAEEQDERGVLRRQRALGLHAPAELCLHHARTPRASYFPYSGARELSSKSTGFHLIYKNEIYEIAPRRVWYHGAVAGT